ncbi:uncharacterized protein LOC133193939 [Saccostrea echinata]|uniref:uncharacterized protein LOC133193939 n=1 Tax=Saccostrea echinata TaxID=191078 RepID=UPI002A81A04B|nr:uncharacterized protein LOC133193939 [Saccostrea echinata]
MDCLDALITGACLHLLEKDNLDSKPNRKQELFEAQSTDDKYKFLRQIAKDILDRYVNLNPDLRRFEEKVQELDVQSQQIKDMFDHRLQKYICVSCEKQYKKVGHLKRHLKEKHLWDFTETETEEEEKPYRISLYRASLMKCLLLLKDTNDGYNMGDGDRIMINAKFQMLLSGVCNHTKYQIWLFRFLAYYHCILSPRDAHEYKWNCTSNLSGGTGHNILNDNLVEIMVHRLKEKLRTQGANVTYESARKAALSLQVQDQIKQNAMHEIALKPKGITRTEPSKKTDVELIIDQFKKAEIFDCVPGRQFHAFSSFQDLFSRVKDVELHKWIQSQLKEALSYEIV